MLSDMFDNGNHFVLYTSMALINKEWIQKLPKLSEYRLGEGSLRFISVKIWARYWARTEMNRALLKN